MDAIRDHIIRFRQHDHSTFDLFYDMTKKQVFFAIIGIVKDDTVAEDLMQETYMAFLKTIDRVDPDKNVIAYMTTIARNLAIDRYNEGKRVIHSDDVVTHASDARVPQEEMGVMEMLEVLPETEAEIVTLHVVNDLTFKEIASIVNKPLGTVLWLYHKAIKTLKAHLGE
jgi:RNA polymerase sigma-70 factor, ECF subfamily